MDTDSRKKDILIFGEGPADGLGDTTITAEAKYSVKITESRSLFESTLQWGQQFFIC